MYNKKVMHALPLNISKIGRNILPKSKRAQGMSTETIILLILGLIVLVALIWGFVTGFSGFKKILKPSNVDTIVEDCAVSCSLNNRYDFCSGERNLRAVEDDLEVKTSCAVLAGVSQFGKYGIEECSSITCDLSCADIIIDDKKGDPSLSEGKYDLSALAKEESCFIA